MSKITFTLLVLLPLMLNSSRILQTSTTQLNYVSPPQPLLQPIAMPLLTTSYQPSLTTVSSQPETKTIMAYSGSPTNSLSTLVAQAPIVMSPPKSSIPLLTSSMPLLTSPMPSLTQIKPQSLTILSQQLTLTQPCGPNQVPNYQSVCIQPDYIEGCATYDSISTCYSCVNGYILNPSKKCNYNASYTGPIYTIQGCISQSSNIACQVCAQSFYLNGSTCLIGQRNCIKYDSFGSCTQCATDYSLMLSKCRHNNILGCKIQTSTHTCTECYPPFKLTQKSCKIQNCRSLNDYGCVSCECGYYLAPDGTCSDISYGCLRYEKGVCKDCLPHYKLKSGVCQIQGCLSYQGEDCTQCSSLYNLFDGECIFKNCFDWINNQCIACNAGYGLVNGLCVATPTVTCQ